MNKTTFNTTTFVKVSNEYLDRYNKKSCLEMRMVLEIIKKRMEEFIIYVVVIKILFATISMLVTLNNIFICFQKAFNSLLKLNIQMKLQIIKNKSDVFTLDTLSDFCILFALQRNSYDVYCNKEYETDFYSIFNTLGYQILIDFFDFERFHEVVTYEISRILTNVGGYKSLFFFLFEYYYS